MSRVILLTGATRSGKSRLAVELAREFGPRILYVATCRPTDPEMQRRVARHRQERPASWRTVEASHDPAAAFRQQDNAVDGAILDCLTMHVSKLMMRFSSDEAVLEHIRLLGEAMRRAPFPVIVVTNEVGGGLVPTNRLGRRFRDLAGWANQLIAESADEVYLVVAGLSLCLKPQEPFHATRHSRRVAVRSR